MLALKELENLWNYSSDKISSLNPFKEGPNTLIIKNTTEATKHYFFGNGEPVKLDQKFVQMIMNTAKFKEINERIISGKAKTTEGYFSIDMTELKDAFFIAHTLVKYQITTTTDKTISTVTYTIFADDGFWDVDFIDEKFLGGIFGFESQKADGKGPNLERLGGTPYDFIPETINITFSTPNSIIKKDSKYDNPNRQY